MELSDSEPSASATVNSATMKTFAKKCFFQPYVENSAVTTDLRSYEVPAMDGLLEEASQYILALQNLLMADQGAVGQIVTPERILKHVTDTGNRSEFINFTLIASEMLPLRNITDLAAEPWQVQHALLAAQPQLKYLGLETGVTTLGQQALFPYICKEDLSHIGAVDLTEFACAAKVSNRNMVANAMYSTFLENPATPHRGYFMMLFPANRYFAGDKRYKKYSVPYLLFQEVFVAPNEDFVTGLRNCDHYLCSKTFVNIAHEMVGGSMDSFPISLAYMKVKDAYALVKSDCQSDNGRNWAFLPCTEEAEHTIDAPVFIGGHFPNFKEVETATRVVRRSVAQRKLLTSSALYPFCYPARLTGALIPSRLTAGFSSYLRVQTIGTGPRADFPWPLFEFLNGPDKHSLTLPVLNNLFSGSIWDTMNIPARRILSDMFSLHPSTPMPNLFRTWSLNRLDMSRYSTHDTFSVLVRATHNPKWLTIPDLQCALLDRHRVMRGTWHGLSTDRGTGPPYTSSDPGDGGLSLPSVAGGATLETLTNEQLSDECTHLLDMLLCDESTDSEGDYDPFKKLATTHTESHAKQRMETVHMYTLTDTDLTISCGSVEDDRTLGMMTSDDSDVMSNVDEGHGPVRETHEDRLLVKRRSTNPAGVQCAKKGRYLSLSHA